MINKIKTRLASEQGFTLIELLVVIVILGILVAIAVPAYLSFRGSAQDAAGKSNVRSAIPAAEGFYQSQSPNTYTGLNNAALVAAAPGVSPHALAAPMNSGAGYCIEDSAEGNTHYYYIGGSPSVADAADPGVGTVTAGDCPSDTDVALS